MSSDLKTAPVFLTGASGFIGGEIARRLLAEGRSVRALGRRPLPNLQKLGAEIIPGDLADLAALRRGCAGAGTVFHVASRVGVWGPAADFRRVNVDGTRHVIDACRAAGVARLVYTSSPSVVYHGHDLRGVDESAPLCTQAPSAYPTTKATAEREVLAAHTSSLSTIALRPHLVFGPGDKNIIPRILALADKGRLKIVGSGKNRVDLTHITNVIDAHLLAERALVWPDSPAAGKPYFITNGEPVILWDWVNALLVATGRRPVTKHISLSAASTVGGILETLWRVLPLSGEPPMTRFVAKEMATDHWFDISAARRYLGYQPRISLAAGTAELIELIKGKIGAR